MDDALNGATLSRYRVLARRGAGGMAVVYRAHDPAVDRDVALKVVRADLAAACVGRLLHP